MVRRVLLASLLLVLVIRLLDKFLDVGLAQLVVLRQAVLTRYWQSDILRLIKSALGYVVLLLVSLEGVRNVVSHFARLGLKFCLVAADIFTGGCRVLRLEVDELAILTQSGVKALDLALRVSDI